MIDLKELARIAEAASDYPSYPGMTFENTFGKATVLSLLSRIAELERRLEPVMVWVAAEQARWDTIGAYNAKLAEDRARDEFPPRIEPEYRAMEAARRAEDLARNAMFLALRQAARLLSPEEPS